MPEITGHPSREQLSAYNLGQLPPDEATTIESHISECEPCCETVINLSSDDTFVGLLRETRQLAIDDPTLAHDSQVAKSSSATGDIPAELAEHPRYEIVRLIGKGGMGDVYEAIHRKMERRVALKVINRALFQKAEAVNRFHREVKTAAQLTHPNIVTSHDADQAGDFHFMVMEYVDGVDLSQTVKDRGALPVAEACDYIQQAAIGLQHAHERGMVHRDIKPHNVMVTADGTIKILDFGLASLAPEALADVNSVEACGELTAAGAIMGTPDFISPEQAEDARNADIRSDIYSLGATLYYLLSGRVPFDEGSVMYKLKSHAQVEPESLDSVRADVPKELVAIVSKMLAKNPDERYLTPQEVAKALESFLRTWHRGGAISQGPSPSSVRGNTLKSGDKDSGSVDAGRGWLLVTTAVVLVAACLAGGLYYMNGNFGGVRLEATAQEDAGSLGTHPLTIVDTSGKKPLGGTSSTHQDDTSGTTTHSFRSANGRYNIALVDKVLTVNGKRYTLENPTDAIRIVDDRVEITQVAALPSKPELKITSKTVNKGTAGRPSVHDWNFKGRDVIDFKVRLLLAQNGKTDVIQEFDFDEIPTEFANKVRLEVRDPGTGADGKRKVNAILFVESSVPSRNTSLHEDKGLSISVEAPFSNTTELADLEPIDPGQTKLLLALSYWKGDMTHDLSMESMTAATKDGNVNFLFVTLDWSPASPDHKLLQGDWETVSVTEGGKQLAAEDGFGGPLLQIKGDKFVIAEKNPNGVKTEFDKGRIEIDSTATPKTIDFIGRNKQRLGIYEHKDGALKICFAEQNNVDDVQIGPAKRPAMFEAPAGSSKVLLECRRVGVHTPETQSKSAGSRPAASLAPRVFSRDEEEEADRRKMLQFMFEERPDLQKRVAEELVSNGDEANAKRVLRNIRQTDPKAKASLDLAKIYENKGDFEQAADAFLDAYRRQPDLLSYDHIDTIIKAERTSEFADVFTVENLRKLGYVDPSTKIVRRLILNEATREDGVKFLRRVWVARPDTHFDLLRNRQDELWPLIPDPIPLIRTTVLPTKFGEEAAGWDRFTIDWINDREGGGSSRLLELQPLVKDKQKVNPSLGRLADDVENAIGRNPQWKAGVALLGYLEAELGNEQRAIELFDQVLANQESPITYQSAWAFGSVLENKSEALDQIAIKLYERSVSLRDVYQEAALRVSPLKHLATLYAKHGQREKARQLLTQLAEPPKNRWVICSPARVPRNALRCIECHQKERNLYDFTVMSDKLTEIGYPVEALMSLYRVDASFHNAYGSDEEWAKAIAPDSLPNAFDWEYAGKENFKPIKKKAEAAITPQIVLEALNAGAFTGDAKDERLIELNVGVRGENGKPKLFSPVIDILELSASANGDQAAIANVQIDQLLAEEFEEHPKNLNAGIAATLFAFTRGDLEAAKTRSQKLVERVNATEPGQNDIALWLVARRALDHETTKTNGEVFAKRALAAAEKSVDPLFREAIVRGQKPIGNAAGLKNSTLATMMPKSRTIVRDFHSVAEYDLAGTKVWEADLTYIDQCWGLDSGERVVTGWKSDQEFMERTTETRLIVFRAGDGPARELWSLDSIGGARPLPSKEILVWNEEFVRRYDLTGRKLWETKISWKDQRRKPLDVEPLSNGNLRVMFRNSTKGSQFESDTAVEIDDQGRVVGELSMQPKRKMLERLPNGNSLVLLLDDEKRTIEELDTADQIVWSYINDRKVFSLQRLPNGDTLIGALGQVKAIDAKGKVTWKREESLLSQTSGHSAYRYFPVMANERSENDARK